MTCSMCDNPKWTWYEVLGADCGVCDHTETFKKLCDVHQDIFREQMQELSEKGTVSETVKI